jgi:hypothetical protein
MCGDNRLRQVQLLGGSRNRAALGHGEKRSESEVEIVWIHRIPSGGARSGLAYVICQYQQY